MTMLDLAFDPHEARDARGRWTKGRDLLDDGGFDVLVSKGPGYTSINAKKNGRQAGRFSFYDDGKIRMVETDPRFRGQGIAVALLKRARQIEPKLHHDTNLSPSGKKFAAKNPLAVAKALVATPHLDEVLRGLGKRGTGASAGTVDDPINCAGNVVLAAKLLSEGKHIRLNREAEVGTLLDRLAFLTNEAVKKGKKAPDIDLCKVSVPKTNLFCAQSKGIPRARMPQLSGTPVPGSRADHLKRVRGTEVDILPEFRKTLGARGIKVTDKSVPADHLKATQDQLIGPKVAGIYEAMKAAQPGSGLFERIYVTRDGYVIDGHHRWAAQVALEVTKGTDPGKMRMKVAEIDMEIGEALDYANAFANDWGIPQQGFVLTGPAVPPSNTGRTTNLTVDQQFAIDLVRHVRTQAGAKKYGQPIGSVIVRDKVPEHIKDTIADRVHDDPRMTYHKEEWFTHQPLGTVYKTQNGRTYVKVHVRGGLDGTAWTPDPERLNTRGEPVEQVSDYGMMTEKGYSPEDVKVQQAAAKTESEKQAAWPFVPGQMIRDTSAKSRAQWLDDAPVGTSVAVREKGQPLRVWTKKVSTYGDEPPHWTSQNPSGNTDEAYDGARLTGSVFGEQEWTVPPNFGGDIDKVLHPKTGSKITYLNRFSGDDAEPVELEFRDDGKFHGTVLPTTDIYEPVYLLRQVTMLGTENVKIGDDTSTIKYLFWAADADRLDPEFKAGVTHTDAMFPGLQGSSVKPLDVPHGWTQSTPREAFDGDPTLSLSYYNRMNNSSSLRLFKGPHGEVAVVDDAGEAKFLPQFLTGISEAMEVVKDAPGIKDTERRHLTFTVGQEWTSQSDALAFVRMTLPDDVQVNPALVNGTFNGGDPSIHEVTSAVRPYKSMLDRLTAFKDYYGYYRRMHEHPDEPVVGTQPDQNWWGPSAGEATNNIFTATLVHELGHVNDARRGDTGNGGLDADPEAVAFWQQHLGISQYAATNAAEGYAEAFSEYHFERWLSEHDPDALKTIPHQTSALAGAYALKYGWTEPASWEDELMGLTDAHS